MEVDERLQVIVAGCRWVKDPSLAASLIPTLAVEAPAFVPLPGSSGESRPAIPLTSLAPLVDALAALLPTTFAAAKAGKIQVGVENLDANAASSEPLVALLADWVAQCGRPGLRSGVVPALALAWVMRRVVSGKVGELPGTSAEPLAKLQSELAALPTPERAKILVSLGWALASRLSAAVGLAAASGVPVQLGGIYRLLLPNALVFGLSGRDLDGADALSEVATLLDLRLPAALIGEVRAAVQASLSAHKGRLQAGKANAADLCVRAALPDDVDAGSAWLHPVAGPVILSLAEQLAEEKGLKAAGISKPTLKALTDPTGLRALGAAWRTFCQALGTWDLLISMVELVVPVRWDGSKAVTPGGALPTDARWGFLVPRVDARTSMAAVVAVRLSELRLALMPQIGARGWTSWAVERALELAIRKLGGSVREWRGDHLICAWPTPELAIRQVQILREQMAPGKLIAMGPEETEVRIPEAASLGFGLAVGILDGGCDGESASLGGEAVATAVALAGCGRIGRLMADPLGARRGGFGLMGLENEGVIASGPFVKLAMERAKRRNEPVHVLGEGGAAGGVEKDFLNHPVAGWWAPSKDLVICALGLGEEGAQKGACELRFLAPAELQEFFRSDATIKKAVPSASSARDPFGEPSHAGHSARAPMGLAPSAPAVEESGFALPSDDSLPGFSSAPPPSPAPAKRENPPSRVAAPMLPPPTEEGFAFVDDLPASSALHALQPPPKAASKPADPFGQEAPVVPAAKPKVGPPMVAAADPFADPFADAPAKPAPDPFATAPKPAADPFATAPKPAADPFASSPAKPAADPFGSSPAKPAADPFAQAAAKPAADPFAAKPAADPFAAPPKVAADPFGAPAPKPPADPFADPFADPAPKPTRPPEPPAPAPRAAPPMVLDEDPFAFPDPAPKAPAPPKPAPKAAAAPSDDPFAFPDPAPPRAPAPSAPMMLPDDPFAEPATQLHQAPVGRRPQNLGPPMLVEPEPPKAPARPAAPARSMSSEFVKMLRSYVVAEEGGRFHFGMRDGDRLRDAFSVDSAMEEEEACERFLRYKIAERFQTHAERSVVLDAGARLRPLTADLIVRACARSGM